MAFLAYCLGSHDLQGNMLYKLLAVPIQVYIHVYVAKKTGCLKSYHLKISCWCNLLLARQV